MTRTRVAAALAALLLASIAPPVAAEPAAAAFAQLAKADAVVEGSPAANHLVYVFFDANCLYCRLTWKALQPYEKVGLQVRWVPVAYQQPSSVGRAAAIMLAADRVAALRANETGYQATHFDGGIAPLAKVPPALAEQFAANTRLMRQFGSPGTPLLVWRAADGAVRSRPGMPRLSELAGITGLPEQANGDPELQPFR
jgi:thiol:disulfide interchange protein DsbG